MATTEIPLTTTPAEITGLTSGTNYGAQNRSAGFIFAVTVAGASTPTAAEMARAKHYAPDESFLIQPQDSESLWAWCDANYGNTGRVVYDPFVE